MNFIDVHCHLDFYKDEEIEKIINNSKNENVKVIVSNGINPESNRKILQISKKYSQVRPALGIYPIDALNIPEDSINKEIDFIKKNKKELIAIGEVGMDFVDKAESQKQKDIFVKFIILAHQMQVPIIVHSRKAEKDCIEILEDMDTKKLLMHCFSGKKILVKRIIKNDWYLSIPTCVPRSTHFQQVIVNTPLSNLLCETDSPFMHPLGAENKNEPANIVASYKKIAEIKNISVEEVASEIEKNFTKLFYSKC